MFLTPLLSVLAPHECLGCLSESALICSDCRRGLQPAILRCYRCHAENSGALTCALCADAAPLQAVYAATRYTGIAKDAVWKLKFGRARAAATEMGAILALSLGRRNLSGAVVTHVPTANSRVRQRGYDQAALIAKAFAAQYGLPYTSLLARHGKHKQVGASKQERVRQLQGDFEAVRPRRITGAHIILVDDVITTGATLEAAAGALLAAGALRVDGAVFAQA